MQGASSTITPKETPHLQLNYPVQINRNLP